MDNIKTLLGKRIKELRQKRRYTQEKLAEMANIEIPSLSNIENGEIILTTKHYTSSQLH